MNAKILLVSKQANATELSRAFGRARISYGLINVIAPDMKRMRGHLGQAVYDVVIVDQLTKRMADEVVQEVLNTVPWQEVIVIGKRPLTDTLLQVRLMASMDEAATAVPDMMKR